jgi:hypothetical protein
MPPDSKETALILKKAHEQFARSLRTRRLVTGRFVPAEANFFLMDSTVFPKAKVRLVRVARQRDDVLFSPQ